MIVHRPNAHGIIETYSDATEAERKRMAHRAASDRHEDPKRVEAAIAKVRAKLGIMDQRYARVKPVKPRPAPKTAPNPTPLARPIDSAIQTPRRQPMTIDSSKPIDPSTLDRTALLKRFWANTDGPDETMQRRQTQAAQSFGYHRWCAAHEYNVGDMEALATWHAMNHAQQREWEEAA